MIAKETTLLFVYCSMPYTNAFHIFLLFPLRMFNPFLNATSGRVPFLFNLAAVRLVGKVC